MDRVLIVEDESSISRFIELELGYEGYEVLTAFDGRTGLDMAINKDVDVIILDIMLPELNGIEVCRRLRKVKDTPIIMLTAKDHVMDKVMGLDMGADDYLTKPFHIEELLARLRVLIKRGKPNNTSEKNILTCGPLTIDKERHIAKYEKQEIDLTKKEFDLLLYLMENKNIVRSRENILDAVWGYEYYGDTNIIDVYIRYLRSKIDQTFNKEMIHTVRGVGYIMKDE
ncbi:MAG: response regulator transcription factor [Peptostreptococcales bacterium]|jgi:two-component system response regulator ArlR